jgi:hypothetical protein
LSARSYGTRSSWPETVGIRCGGGLKTSAVPYGEVTSRFIASCIFRVKSVCVDEL